jgi:hypothetical protein
VLQVTSDLLAGADPTSMQIGAMPLRKMRLLTHFMYDNGLTSVLVPADAVITDDFIPYANDFDHKAFIAQAKAMH